MKIKKKVAKVTKRVEKVARVKLTEKQEAALMQDIKAGKLGQLAIAEKYGVSHGYVWFRTKTGKTYNERVKAHGGPLRTEIQKGKKQSTNKKESALAKLKNKR